MGLTGEVRNIQNAEKRVQEGGKLGFSACILPRSNAERLKKSMKRSGALPLKLYPVDNIAMALNLLERHLERG